MPSIAQNQKIGQAAVDAGLLVPADPPKPSQFVPSPQQVYPLPNPYSRGPLPAASVQQPDMQRGWQTGRVPQNRLIPPASISNPVVGAQAASQAIVITRTSTGSSLLLETNNRPNNSQSILNLLSGANISLTADSQGGVTITNTASASTNFIPLPNNGIFFMARSIVGAGSLQTIGDSSTGTQSGGTGTFSNGAGPTAADGVFSQVSSGAAGPNSFFWLDAEQFDNLLGWKKYSIPSSIPLSYGGRPRQRPTLVGHDRPDPDKYAGN